MPISQPLASYIPPHSLDTWVYWVFGLTHNVMCYHCGTKEKELTTNVIPKLILFFFRQGMTQSSLSLTDFQASGNLMAFHLAT